ncbi:cytochrome c maturation protein CcmE domain-containing protein [Marivirga arenosa]|uniref:Cytochrome c maturation protein CcmE n=1 Tax=Marivirga arenosa TaxID=3059076 RepID=A0AA49JDB5_9BACT|nr:MULTISPECIES: cytochrome c maturation protein CcmE [unclassified Marivirga]WKK82701.1 cytochrome c maturation protein CcmE [Marivirga sp. BKB1-2]WKK86597.2 cytochrome c maturation protein CcmE [Marivirga sp. ABR2-2]
MKKSYIFGIIVIAAAIMMIVSTAGDASSYVTFKDAHDMAVEGNDNKIHVVGQLKKNTAGEIVGLHPSDDKLSFTFLMVDENGMEQEVFYNEPMPADFKRSEQVVVIGGFQQGMFVADKILMKCPSKYQEETVI